MPGTRSSNDAGVDGRYKFTAKKRDAETGYDYFGTRYYDSWLGRWLQVDSLDAMYPGLSPYNYVLNDPVNIIDPKGLWTYQINGIEVDEDMFNMLAGLSDQTNQNALAKNAEKSIDRPSEKPKGHKKTQSKKTFWNGCWDGVKSGAYSTWELLSGLGNEKGLFMIANASVDEWNALSEGDPLHVVAYAKTIPDKNAYDWGFDLGFFSEKAFETWATQTLITRWYLYPSGGMGLDFGYLGRFDFHNVRLGGKKIGTDYMLPHFDSELFGVHHWPWHQIDKWWRGI